MTVLFAAGPFEHLVLLKVESSRLQLQEAALARPEARMLPRAAPRPGCGVRVLLL